MSYQKLEIPKGNFIPILWIFSIANIIAQKQFSWVLIYQHFFWKDQELDKIWIKKGAIIRSTIMAINKC